MSAESPEEAMIQVDESPIDAIAPHRDIEDYTALDAPDDDDPVGFWERRQRELVTSVLDYNLNSLSELIQARSIDLQPSYQRRERWNRTRQSRLIESFLMNVPVPPVFLNEDTYGVYSVIDGKQRLTAIHEFIRGRLRLTGLKVFKDINGETIDSLPVSLQAVVKTRANVRAVILLRQSDPTLKFEVFRRLNTGGVRLNPQEIRNSTWPGPLNDLILQLSVDSRFHRLLGITNKQRSATYEEMRDAELVLRYFTFRKNWQTFRGGMMRQLDTFIAQHQHMAQAQLAELQDDFLRTLEVVRAAFGEHAFRRWVPEREQWRRQVLASLYDAEMFACMGFQADEVAPHRMRLTEMVQSLCADSDFRKSIDAATNTPLLFRDRITRMQRAMRDIIPT